MMETRQKKSISSNQKSKEKTCFGRKFKVLSIIRNGMAIGDSFIHYRCTDSYFKINYY